MNLIKKRIKYVSGATYGIKINLDVEIDDIGIYHEDVNKSAEIYSSVNPFNVTGYCESRIEELKKYNGEYLTFNGINGVDYSDDTIQGSIAYYINNIKFYNITGTSETIFVHQSSGITEQYINDFVVFKKDEYMGISQPLNIDSRINVNRQNENIFEPIYRLCGLSKISKIENFGGGAVFNIIKNS